jgi:SNF2 family DNA or RNA helicase
MGLGKTITILSFLVYVTNARKLNCQNEFGGVGSFNFEKSKASRAMNLVIAPLSVIHNWIREIRKVFDIAESFDYKDEFCGNLYINFSGGNGERERLKDRFFPKDPFAELLGGRLQVNQPRVEGVFGGKEHNFHIMRTTEE